MELSPFWFGLYKLVKFAVYPFTWIVLLLTALTVLLWLPHSAKFTRWSRILALMVTVLVIVLSNPFVATILAGFLETRYPPFAQPESKQFDAIVVLSGGAHGKGSLRPHDQLTGTSIQRTFCGVDLFQRGHAPTLLVIGGDASIFGEGPKEALEMKHLAMRLGVPEAAILLEDRSRTTYENAIGAKRLLDHGSLLLVTSASHMPRAVGLFHKQGFEVTAAPCHYALRDRPLSGMANGPFDLLPDIEALHLSTTAINEMVGIVVYRLTGKI